MCDEWKDIPLPKDWPKHTGSAFLHALSLGAMLFARAISRASNWKHNQENTWLVIQLSRCQQHMAMQETVIWLLTQRFGRLNPRKRPQYNPGERRVAVELQAANCLNNAEIGRMLLVDRQTAGGWRREGYGFIEPHLLERNEPPNKYPEYVRQMVRKIKTYHPAIGKRKLAEMLTKGGLHTAISTVGRMFKEKPKQNKPLPAKEHQDDVEQPEEPAATQEMSEPEIVAKYPNHVWSIDLTVIPLLAGLACSWSPGCLNQVYPFAWYTMAVVDIYSRRCMGIIEFKKEPTSEEVQDALETVFQDNRKKPRHIICDKGPQFDSDSFRNWCEDSGIQPPRYGAVKKHGSIAITERFIKSLKYLWLKLILTSVFPKEFRKQLDIFRAWYNSERPHTYLNGCTPDEIYFNIKEPANQLSRFEPRPNCPAKCIGAAPHVPIRGSPGTRIKICVRFLDEEAGLRSRRLPVVEIVEDVA